MSLACCPLIESQTSQHFRFFREEATYDWCFPRQNICSVLPLTPACPGQKIQRCLYRWMSKIVTLPSPLFRFCDVLIESVKMIACTVWLSLLEAIQWRRKHGALRPQKPVRLIRDGEVGGSRILLYLTSVRYTVTTRMILH